MGTTSSFVDSKLSEHRRSSNRERLKAYGAHNNGMVLKVGIIRPIEYSITFENILNSAGEVDLPIIHSEKANIPYGNFGSTNPRPDESTTRVYEFFEVLPDRTGHGLKQFCGQLNEENVIENDINSLSCLRKKVTSIMNIAEERRQLLNKIFLREINNKQLESRFSFFTNRERTKIKKANFYRQFIETNQDLDPADIERRIICHELQEYSKLLQKEYPELIIFVGKEEYMKSLHSESSTDVSKAQSIQCHFFYILVKKRIGVSIFGVDTAEDNSIMTTNADDSMEYIPTASMITSGYFDSNSSIGGSLLGLHGVTLLGEDYSTAIPLCEVVTEGEFLYEE